MADTATPIATEDTPSTGMIPMQGDPESTTVTAPPQQPIQPGETPSTGMIPSATMPDYSNPSVMLPHESWWKRALDATASTMAGDQTIHITKDKDGNVTMTHDPSTGGEKWGRIAAAALTGAAAGLANSQGPGGLARAGAAGFQAGAQMPQQREQQAQQQVDFGNRQVMFKANHAAMDQKYIQNAELMRQGNIKFNQEQADRYTAIQKERAEADGYEDVGDFNGVTDLPDFAAQHPEAMKGHTVADGKYLTFDPIIDPKTGVQTGTHVGLMSQAAGNQPMKDPPPIPQDYYDSKTNSIQTRMIKPVTGTKRNDWETAYKKQLSDNSELAIKVAGVRQKDVTGEPDTPEKSLARASATTDPAEKARYTQLAHDQQQQLLAKAAAGRAVVPGIGYTPSANAPTTTPSGAPIVGKQWGGGDPNSAFERVSQMLQSGRMTLSEVKQMRGKGNPTQQDYIGRADQIDREAGGSGLSPTTQEARYQARRDTEKDYSAAGQSGKKIGSFSTLLEHLGDIHDSVNELRQTNSPYLNRPYNELRQGVLGNKDVGPAEIRASVPAHEFASVINNNNALTETDKKTMPQYMTENMTPAQQQANSKQIARTAIERLAPVFQGYRTTMNGDESPTQLTPRAIQTLRNMGLYDYAMQELHGSAQQQPQGGAPPAAMVPPGHDVSFKNHGGVWRNVNGTVTRVSEN